jgi:hypothetical protein
LWARLPNLRLDKHVDKRVLGGRNRFAALPLYAGWRGEPHSREVAFTKCFLVLNQRNHPRHKFRRT